MLELLRRFRGWMLFLATIICLVLIVGLIHDFGLGDPEAGWLTSRPEVAVTLIVIGFILMFLQRFGERQQE